MTCSVKDLTDMTVMKIVLDAANKCSDLVEEIGRTFQYEVGSFQCLHAKPKSRDKGFNEVSL